MPIVDGIDPCYGIREAYDKYNRQLEQCRREMFELEIQMDDMEALVDLNCPGAKDSFEPSQACQEYQVQLVGLRVLLKYTEQRCSELNYIVGQVAGELGDCENLDPENVFPFCMREINPDNAPDIPEYII